jgi:hypothetical protein
MTLWKQGASAVPFLRFGSFLDVSDLPVSRFGTGAVVSA